MRPEELVERLNSRGYQTRREGAEWRSQCPAHNGHDLNMSIRPHPEGGSVCTCHSHGCTRQAVAAALGLTMEEVVGRAKPNGGHAPEPTVYPYRDAERRVVYEVVRTPDKKFWMRLPGAEKAGVGDVKRILFGIPEMLQTKPGDLVCIAEGEKCALAVARLGIPATTNPNGAGKWRQDYTDWLKAHLADRRFLILADNDPPGIEHATAVCESLKRAGMAVAIADLGPLPPAGDIVQWISAGGTAEKLRALAPALKRSRGIRIYSAADLQNRELPDPQEIVPGFIYEGFNLFAGKGKTGKSWLSLDLGIAVASGGRAIGQVPVVQGDVLYLALEDTERRMKKRLLKRLAGEPFPKRLYICHDWPRIGDGCLRAIRKWLEEHPEARMVIIDVLKKIKPPRGANRGVYDDDFDFAEQLKEVGDDYSVGIVGNTHTRKAAAEDVFDEVNCSSGLTGAADAILVWRRKRGDDKAYLSITGRDVDEEKADETAIVLQWHKHLGSWTIMGSAGEVDQSEERRAVIAFLQRVNEPSGPAQAAAALDKNPATMRWLMTRMCEDGQIEKAGYGKYTYTPTNTPNSTNSSDDDDEDHTERWQ